ncbi:hypothetical protein GO755_35000, partial [Spirosoma sp. HMF4905]
MAVPDSTGLKSLIDSNIPDATPTQQRRGKASFVRYVLYQLIDWVTTAINGNLTTWYKVGTTSAPLVNTDDVYRTGKTILGRSTDDGSGAMLQTDSASLGLVNGLSLNRTISVSHPTTQYWKVATLPTSGSYAFLRFALHISTDVVAEYTQIEQYNLVSREIGTGQKFKYSQYAGIDKANKRAYVVITQRSTGERDVYLKTNAGSSAWVHISFLINITCQVYSTVVAVDSLPGTDTQVWSSETTDPIHWFQGDGSIKTTGNLQADGLVRLSNAIGAKKIALYDPLNNDHQFYGFGVLASQFRYQIDSSASAHVFSAGLTPATSKELMRIQGNGLVDVTGMTRVKSFTVPTSDSGVEIIYGASPGNGGILCYDRTAGAYLNLNIDGSNVNVNSGNATTGKMGVNTGSPTSALHVKGSTGHQQLRLETSYTPTSTADTNGAVGQVAWDANYVYVKTTAGWKRTA